jgi:hypothetical protein
MKNNAIVSLIATTSFAFASASCSVSSPVAAPVGTNQLDNSVRSSDHVGAIRPTRARPNGLLFVANVRNNAVDIYEKEPPNALVGDITDGIVGPNGMAVDASGNLFVANVDNQTVTVYPPHSTKPSRTYTNGSNHHRLTNPLNVAIGNDGMLYVVNYHRLGQGSQVLEYPRNSMNPTIAIEMIGGAEGLAVDANNNLYVSENVQVGGRILKFRPRSTTGRDLGIALNFAGGLALDSSGNLVACDQTAPAVYVFPPGATKPSKTITGGFLDPYHVAFGQHFQRLYLADAASDNVFIYSYPSGTVVGTIQRTFRAFGVAVNPPALL